MKSHVIELATNALQTANKLAGFHITQGRPGSY